MFTFTPTFTGTSHNTFPFNIENQLIGFSINSFASMQEQQTEHHHSNLSPNTRSNTNFELPHSRIDNLVQKSYQTPGEYQDLEAAVWTTTPSRQTLFCESVQKRRPEDLAKSITETVARLFSLLSVEDVLHYGVHMQNIEKDRSNLCDDVCVCLVADGNYTDYFMKLAEWHLLDFGNVHSARAIGRGLRESGCQCSTQWSRVWAIIDPGKLTECIAFMDKCHCLPCLLPYMTDLPQNLDKIFRFGDVEQSIVQERKAVGEGVEQNREEVLERIYSSELDNNENGHFLPIPQHSGPTRGQQLTIPDPASKQCPVSNSWSVIHNGLSEIVNWSGSIEGYADENSTRDSSAAPITSPMYNSAEPNEYKGREVIACDHFRVHNQTSAVLLQHDMYSSDWNAWELLEDSQSQMNVFGIAGTSILSFHSLNETSLHHRLFFPPDLVLPSQQLLLQQTQTSPLPPQASSQHPSPSHQYPSPPPRPSQQLCPLLPRDSSSHPPPLPPPRKQPRKPCKRTRTPCKSCRQRKRKCDEEFPCSRCKEQNLACDKDSRKWLSYMSAARD